VYNVYQYIKKTDANSVTEHRTNQFSIRCLNGEKTDTQLFHFMETFVMGNVCHKAMSFSVQSKNK
jgi:hypothetical protein